FGADVSIQGGVNVGASIQAAGDISTGGNSFVQGGAVFGGGKNQLGAPTGLTANAATSGGTLTGTYKYEVTAYDSNGNETTPSNEVTSASLSSQKQPLSWTSVSGAAGYKIYRTAAGGSTGTET